MANRWGNSGNSKGIYLEDSKITADVHCSHKIDRRMLLGRKVMTNLLSILKSWHYFTNKCLSSQGYGFSSSHVQMWELDYKESWASKTEKAKALHSSTLAWKIPWTEEPGRVQSMGLRRVGLDWANSLSLFTFVHWRRKWKPTPVFLPGESQGRQSLVGCCLWGHTELDTTEET